jgi:hypothetical protein
MVDWSVAYSVGVTVSGWFADPGGKVNTFRWWDGEAWTRWLSADPSAPDPGPEPQPIETTPKPAVADPVPADPLDLAALPPPDPADRVVRLPAAVAIVVAVVLLTVIAVGAIVSITADRPLTGPAVNPPPPTQVPAEIAYDPATRKVSFEEMQFIAPAAPFSCDPKARQVPNAFASAFTCTALVHRNYDKKNSNWSAVVSLGHLDDRLRAGGDLTSIARSTFGAIVGRNYPAKVTIKKAKSNPLVGVAPDGKAVLVSAELHVSVRNLPTRYDRLALAVVELKSGEHVAWYSLQPDDSPKDVVRARLNSSRTVTAR